MSNMSLEHRVTLKRQFSHQYDENWFGTEMINNTLKVPNKSERNGHNKKVEWKGQEMHRCVKFILYKFYVNEKNCS